MCLLNCLVMKLQETSIDTWSEKPRHVSILAEHRFQSQVALAVVPAWVVPVIEGLVHFESLGARQRISRKQLFVALQRVTSPSIHSDTQSWTKSKCTMKNTPIRPYHPYPIPLYWLIHRYPGIPVVDGRITNQCFKCFHCTFHIFR